MGGHNTETTAYLNNTPKRKKESLLKQTKTYSNSHDHRHMLHHPTNTRDRFTLLDLSVCVQIIILD